MQTTALITGEQREVARTLDDIAGGRAVTVHLDPLCVARAGDDLLERGVSVIEDETLTELFPTSHAQRCPCCCHRLDFATGHREIAL